MEFDKSKILTVVTADNLKCKQKGWIHTSICLLRIEMNTFEPYPVFLSNDLELPFVSEGKSGMFFYPAPEPTYAERQAEWIRQNNVKAGTKVRVTRTFTEDEDGSCCWEHDDLVGKTGIIQNICPHNLVINMNERNFRAVPYFALEVIKEPTYRPYNSEELNYIVGNILVRKCDGSNILVNERSSPINVRLGDGCEYTAEQLLELFTLNDEPCGIKEEK